MIKSEYDYNVSFMRRLRNPASSAYLDIPSGYYSGGRISTTASYDIGFAKGKEYGMQNGDKTHHITVQTDYMGNSSVQMWVYVDGQRVAYRKDGDGNCYWEGDY